MVNFMLGVLCCLSRSVMSDSATPGASVHGNSPGKNIGVRCHALLQGIFPTQGLNSGLLHHKRIPYHLNHRVFTITKNIEKNI